MEKLDVRFIAKMAKLNMPEDQLQQYEAELAETLKLFENLPNDININENMVDINNTMEARPDVAVNEFTREEMLANVPNTAMGYIKVPKLVD